MLLKRCGKRLVMRVLGVSSLGMLAGGLVFPVACEAQVSALVTTHRAFPYGVVNLSAASGFGNGKYVDGYVKMTGTGMMLYPVGHSGIYHPFVANADGSVTGSYYRESAEAPSQFSTPFSFSAKATNVGAVSPVEFWDIDGTSATKITLIWDVDSRVEALTSGDLSKLRIMGWDTDAKKWTIVPAVIDQQTITGIASGVTAGSITTTSEVIPNTYRIYTLGTEGLSELPSRTASIDSTLKVTTNSLNLTVSPTLANAQTTTEQVAVDKGVTLNIVDASKSADFKINGENFDAPEVVVYPNPVASKLYLRMPASQQLDRLEILDLSGKAVLKASSEATSAEGLNVENLRGGIYIVRLLTVSGLEFNRKVVVKKN